MSDTLYESSDTAIELGQLINHVDDRICMTFTPHARHTLTSVKFRVWRGTGDTPGVATLSLQGVDGSDKPDGSDLATATSDSDTWIEGSPGSLIEWTFASPVVVVAGVRLALVINVPGSSVAEPVTVGYNVNGTPHYTGGEFGTSADGGSSWILSANVEFEFYEYGIRVEGPVAHWKLDEISGTNIVDSVGDNDGTWAGTGAQALTSILSPNKTGLVFDGVSDVVTVPANPVIDLAFKGDVTISAWVKAFSDGGGSQGRIVDKKSAGAGLECKIFGEAAGRVTFAVTYGHSGGSAYIQKNSAFPINEFVMVTVVYDGDNRLVFCLNGVKQELDTDNPGVGTPNDDSAVDLPIGRALGGSNGFDGIIDDVQFYDYALTAGEVRKLYQDTIGKGSLPDAIMLASWGF